MLPEQVWDAPDIPELELFNGRASGGAMPLVWAHAESAKLVRSLHDGRVFDMPQQPYERYVRRPVPASLAVWASQCRIRYVGQGCTLRVQTPIPATVLWTVDGDAAQHEAASRDTTLGAWVADLDTTQLSPGAVVRFAIRGGDSSRPLDDGHAITIVQRAVPAPARRSSTPPRATARRG
jgi:glucoamylase